MMRVQLERLAQNIPPIRHEKNAMKKAEVIEHEFMLYIVECLNNYKFVFPLYKEMKNKINLIQSRK